MICFYKHCQAYTACTTTQLHTKHRRIHTAQLFHLGSMYCFVIKIRTCHPCAFSHENNAEQIYGFETLKWYEFILYYDHHCKF